MIDDIRREQAHGLVAAEVRREMERRGVVSRHLSAGPCNLSVTPSTWSRTGVYDNVVHILIPGIERAVVSAWNLGPRAGPTDVPERYPRTIFAEVASRLPSSLEWAFFDAVFGTRAECLSRRGVRESALDTIRHVDEICEAFVRELMTRGLFVVHARAGDLLAWNGGRIGVSDAVTAAWLAVVGGDEDAGALDGASPVVSADFVRAVVYGDGCFVTPTVASVPDDYDGFLMRAAARLSEHMDGDLVVDVVTGKMCGRDTTGVTAIRKAFGCA